MFKDLEDKMKSLEDIFEKNPEEHNRALSIFTVLTYRIRTEIMPDVEKLIGNKLKRFLLPRRLNEDEKKALLGILCQLPLFYSIYDIKHIFKDEEKKADKINSYLIRTFSQTFGITHKDLLELEEAGSREDGRILHVTMYKICELLNYKSPILTLQLIALCSEKLALIGAETVKALCACSNENLIKILKKTL